MSVPDVFQTEITFVIKELIHAALIEIAKVVTSSGDGEVRLSTACEDSHSTTKVTLHTPELEKKNGQMVSQVTLTLCCLHEQIA